ncbi:hypothetical protein OS493_003524 [Desmophyllum pertusum]|uniref:ShKT domain-containing protein n=1 Tax=Desmophyllum pertusum TaxID=174260 RepID=A0A9X0A5P9_9CNID|nr:hypothetical protein OS493_003524 [Desmophyllum pertusum]
MGDGVVPPQPSLPPKPPTPPKPTSSDCKDSDAFADQCPTLATYEGYCKYHHEWTKKYCAKSCGWCS